MDERRYHTTGWDREQVRRAAPSRTPGANTTPGSTSQNRTKSRPQKKRRKRGNPVVNFFLYIIFVVIASVIIAGIGWLLANDLCALNKPYLEAEITVSKEDSMGDVADKLKEAGLIDYKWFFNIFCAIADAEEKIGIGTFTLNTNMDYRALITGMRSGGGATTVSVTIPEGYSVEQTITLLAEKGVSDYEDLVEAAKNYEFEYDFVDNENLGSISRLEGYLFPNTYEFYVGERASKALDRLLSEFNRQMDEDTMALVEQSGRSLQEIITVASLIEKETDGSDRATIASVIYNRLDNPGFETGGYLQIDAALVYATGNKNLTEDDKQIDSPYNLYTNKGLPPTAITNPGKESIMAALQPEDTKYYYYVLGNDGKHIFSKTYQEHMNVIAGLK